MHLYFYIRDEVLGPMAICVGTYLPFLTTYYVNASLHRERAETSRGSLPQGRQCVSVGQFRGGSRCRRRYRVRPFLRCRWAP